MAPPFCTVLVVMVIKVEGSEVEEGKQEVSNGLSSRLTSS